MIEVWYEETLEPTDLVVSDIVKSLSDEITTPAKKIREDARGIVRVDRPRWGLLDPTKYNLLSVGKGSSFYLIRLGFQLDIEPQLRQRGVRFVYARCQAYLWPAADGQPQPTVYDVIPRDLYDQEPRKINVKVNPQIKLDKIEASVAEASTDFTVGVVEPVIIGWPGNDERSPYWDLRPSNRDLIGVRHLWVVVELPAGCQGVRLAILVEGDIQTRFGFIHIGPRTCEWDGRFSTLIQ